MHSSEDRYHDRGVGAHDWHATRESSNQRVGTPEESEYYAESPPVAPSYASARYTSFDNRRFANSRSSIGKRAFRSVGRFFFAVLIGISATLAWQSYGEEATEMVRTWAPSLGSLLPASSMQPPAAAATLPELVQQLKPMSLDLAIVRRSLEQLAAKHDQLAAKQEQMAQNVAALQAVEQDVRQQIASLPASHAVHVPPRKPTSSSGPPAPPLPTGQTLH